MTFNIDFEISAIVFIILLIVLAGNKRQLNNFQSRIFWVFLFLSLGNSCLNIITCFMIWHYEAIPKLIFIVANGVYLSVQFILPAILLFYVYDKIRQSWGHRWLINIAVYSLAAFGVLMTISSYWTHFIFYADSQGYHRGKYHSLLYLFAVIYTIVSVILIIKNQKLLKQRRIFSMSLMMSTAVVPAAIQFFIPNYMLTGIGLALAVYILYFDLEKSTAYEDVVTGALNRSAFNEHIRDYLHHRVSEKVFMLGLDNFKIVNETYGMSFGDDLLQKIVIKLQEDFGSNYVFRIDGDRFAVVCREKEETSKIRKRLERIISKKWRIRTVWMDVSACICLVHSGQLGEEDVIHALDYAMNRVKRTGKGGFLEVDEKIMDDMARLAEVERALLDAIEANQFEVRYQPIYDVHAKRFRSMEALARLQVPGYGYVSPEEFILVAENNGTILKVGLLVLEEVCRFINEYDLKSRGVDYIEVNLSVVQCMQATIYDDIMGVLKKYNIPPEMINLEITESAEAYSQERMVRNMARLSLKDITFSLDDYGSGYSNINYLVDLPFSLAKVDKYLVWAAMKKFSSRRVLESTIAMFKDINLKIVTEGIETREMMDMVIEMGADYLQGYYFSKPVSKEMLVKCLEKEYLEKLLN